MKGPLMMVILLGLLPGCPGAISVRDHSDVRGSEDAGRIPAGFESSSFTRPTAIPDGDPRGVTIGPLAVAGKGRTIQDVILGLQISHAYSGDLSIELHYDTDNDGAFEASTPVEIYLARVGTRDAQELCAYPIELGGTYFFHDEGWSEAGEEGTLMIFNGLPGGGSFYLSVVDQSAGDAGTVLGWTVSVRTPAPGLVAGTGGPGATTGGMVQ